MSDGNIYKKPTMSDEIIRSFGRVRGRKLGAEQESLVGNLLPKISIDIEKLDLKKITEGKSHFCVEIGFGGGEHLAGYATQNPDAACIGCEPFLNGVARLLKQIAAENIPNIKILHGDARLLLAKLPENIVDKVFVLFPDPWPKSKHHRKRIISAENLDALERVIKKGGELEVATDHVEYGKWIEEHLLNHSAFEKIYITDTPPADWIPTRYQEKAAKQGRGAKFFRFVRV